MCEDLAILTCLESKTRIRERVGRIVRIPSDSIFRTYRLHGALGSQGESTLKVNRTIRRLFCGLGEPFATWNLQRIRKNWFRVPILASVLLVFGYGPMAAADDPSTRWQVLLRQGEAAEDNADYDVARRRFVESCRAATQAGESRALSAACLKSAEAHAIEGKLEKSQEILRKLVGKLKSDASTTPNDLAAALLELAEVQAARSEITSSVASLREAAESVPDSSPLLAARTFARVGQFYLAAGEADVGGGWLDRALRRIQGQRELDDPDYIQSATLVSAILRWNGREQEAKKLIEPVAERSKKRLNIFHELSPKTWSALIGAVDEYRYLLEGPENDDWYEQIKAWRGFFEKDDEVESLPSESTPEFEHPTLIWKVEPEFTHGARAVRVEGTVVLSVEIWPDGLPHKFRVIRPLPFGLSWSAARAVREWRFKPAMKLGRAVKARATIEVNFRLARQPSKAD